jgi:hypothetical protein
MLSERKDRVTVPLGAFTLSYDRERPYLPTIRPNDATLNPAVVDHAIGLARLLAFRTFDGNLLKAAGSLEVNNSIFRALVFLREAGLSSDANLLVAHYQHLRRSTS